jgi:hypothetical protein
MLPHNVGGDEGWRMGIHSFYLCFFELGLLDIVLYCIRYLSLFFPCMYRLCQSYIHTYLPTYLSVTIRHLVSFYSKA